MGRNLVVALLVAAATIGASAACQPGVVEGPPPAPPARQVDGGRLHTCAVTDDTGVWCWGDNTYGQLGTTQNNGSSVPTPPAAVPGVSGAVEVATGAEHTCVLLEDATVTCFGRNIFGQAGPSGTSGTYLPTLPTPVDGVAGAAALTAGRDHTCALLDDGAVTCWGANYDGQISQPPTPDNEFPSPRDPTQVPGSGIVTALAAGATHTCATIVDGSVRCWGTNISGESGSTTLAPSLPVTTVPDVSGAIDVASGELHSCALISGGSVSCWGNNTYGQLGTSANNGTSEPNLPEAIPNAPAPVAGIGSATGIAATAWASCVVSDDLIPTCWGSNDWGELGSRPTIGTMLPNPDPGTVANISDVADMGAGTGHLCAVQTNGRVLCWGANHQGQMGDSVNNGTTNPNLPRFVPGF